MVGIALLPFSAKVGGEWIRGVILWRSGSVRSYKSRNNVIFQLLLSYMTHPWHSPYTCLQTKKKKASPYLQAKLELDRMHIFYWTVMKQWKIWHQTNTTWHWNKMTIWYWSYINSIVQQPLYAGCVTTIHCPMKTTRATIVFAIYKRSFFKQHNCYFDVTTSTGQHHTKIFLRKSIKYKLIFI